MDGLAVASAGAGAPVLQLLAQVVQLPSHEPSMRDIPPAELRLMNDMVSADVSVAQLLTDPQVRAGREGGSKGAHQRWR
jgi:hypothetical protein